jgi:hypothetical protein
MRRTSTLCLVALTLSAMLSGCSAPKEPEPKLAGGNAPDTRLKGPERDMGMSGSVK